MDTDVLSLSRRAVLALVVAGGLAGCAGGAAAPETDDNTQTETPSEPGGLGGDDGDTTSGTSLAGSCEAAFGDTDVRYDPGERDLQTTFAYPLGGELTAEESSDGEQSTALQYTDGDGTPLHALAVTERGPLDGEPADVGAEAVAGGDDWEDAGPLTVGGDGRTVAAERTENAVVYRFGVDGRDGTYAIEIRCGVADGEACPTAYESVCRRVADSVELR